MASKWQNVDAGPRQVKDFNRAISKLRGEGQAQDELYGVIGGNESRSTTMAMMGPVRAEVAAMLDAIGDGYGWQVTRATVRQIIADLEGALPTARKSRPVVDNRRSADEEAERVAAMEARDAERRAVEAAQEAVMSAVMAKAPAGAQALIIAEYHVDDSDIMTDYFNSITKREVAIGFRTGSREDFRQLHAAAARFPETADIAFDEFRENYSMGSGNYLSDHGSMRSGSGWVIRSRAFPCKWVSLTEDAIPDKPAAAPVAASAPATSGPRSTAISGDVMDILRNATVDGNAVKFNDRMDRATYLAVAEVLKAEGGKWNRKAQAILFPSDAAPVIAAMLEDGSVVRPQDEGYFPTPAPVVADMLALADLEPGMEVLEPSAGDGAIARAVAAEGCEVDCVELNEKRASGLRAAGFARTVDTADFLAMSPLPRYDRVLMNPPFSGKQDIAHVRHALGFLKPGGLLIAVMAAGVEFRDDRATAEFRQAVDDAGGFLEPLPEDSFKVSGTGVRTVLVAIPAASAAEQAA
jgi:predicted RNA methylase